MSVELLILGMHVGLLTELVHVRILPVVLARAPQHADREEAEEEEHVPSGLKRPEHCPPRVEAVGEYDEELGGDPHTGDDNEEEEDGGGVESSVLRSLSSARRSPKKPSFLTSLRMLMTLALFAKNLIAR